MKVRYIHAAIATLLIGGLGCGNSGGTTASIPAPAPLESTDDQPAAAPPTLVSDEAPAPASQDLHPEVTVKTTLGDFRLRLDAERAPATVDNFLANYVDRGFYVDTIFHHVDPEYIVVGGGFTADLEAKEARAPIRNESDNGLKNVKGTISMARDPEFPDSATSQFIINVVDNPGLDTVEGEDEGYAVFGEVVEGFDTIQKIASAQVQSSGDFERVPVEPVVITETKRAE